MHLTSQDCTDLIAKLQQITDKTQRIAMMTPYLYKSTLDNATLLMLVVEAGDYDLTMLLLEIYEENGTLAQINKNTVHGMTALRVAVCNGFENIVKLLTSYPECQLDVPVKDGESPFLDAVYSRKKKIALLLLNKGAYLNVTNIRGETAFTMLAERGDWEFIKVLQNAWPQSKHSSEPIAPYLEQALRHAAAQGEIDTVKFLCEQQSPININSVDKNGLSALVLAVRAGHQAVVDYLLLHATPENINQAFVHAAQKVVRTEIMQIAPENKTSYGKDELAIMTSLFEKNASINSVDEKGNSVFIVGAKHPAFLKKLKKHFKDVNFNYENPEGNTVLTTAVAASNRDSVRLLLDAGADPSFITRKGIHVLHVVRDLEVLQILLAKLTTDLEKNRPMLNDMLISVAKGKKGIAALNVLLANGAQINAVDDEGNSALMIAIEQGSEDTALAFMKADGVNYNHRNKFNSCALIVAAIHGKLAVIILLLEQPGKPYSADDYMLAFSMLLRVLVTKNIAAYEAVAIQLLTLYLSHPARETHDIYDLQAGSISIAINTGQFLLLEQLLALPPVEQKINFQRYIIEAIEKNSTQALDLLLTAMIKCGEDIWSNLGAWQSRALPEYNVNDVSQLLSDMLDTRVIAKRYLECLYNSSPVDVHLAAVINAAKPYKDIIMEQLLELDDVQKLKNSIKMDKMQYINGLSQFIHTTNSSWLWANDGSVDKIKGKIAEKTTVAQSYSSNTTYGFSVNVNNDL